MLSGIICNLAGSSFQDIIINGNTFIKSSNNSYHMYQGFGVMILEPGKSEYC